MATNDQTNLTLNNYSDDSQIKKYISDILMPRVFHDIPMNTLNTGFFSVASEYMSQALENLAFTASFYENESFITKAVLSDSIYAEAAIFNIGYSYAIPSMCNFMIELKIDDLKKNATKNPSTNLYEFILDRDTKINLTNGSIYSLDYDVLIQFTDTADPTWSVQYTNLDEKNSISVNKNPFILYRTSEEWLCIFVKMSEFTRQSYTVVNNMTNGIPNDDYLITCQTHICGFDIKYIDGDGNEQYLDKDHILPIHSDVKDLLPYVHYIMDSPKTIRFKFQLNGNRYFVPDMNSSFIITVYTCHGESANFTAYTTEESVSILTSTNKYPTNGNVQKTAFVISASKNGTNIGTNETVRRETIKAYNTANVISSDHDIEEWFKTFFFKNILYPFFFKRRDDPWGRIWSGFISLTDKNGDVYRTNTLHADIPYNVLYANNENIISADEIIIPPGWTWVYKDAESNRYTLKPLVVSSNNQVETAKTMRFLDNEFLFANPFGIRIQKSPFAIGYFNPWINETTTASIVLEDFQYQQPTPFGDADKSIIYHGTPAFVHVTRTYQDDYYHLETVIMPNQGATALGSDFVKYTRSTATVPTFAEKMWNYFVKPFDLYAKQIPILVQNPDDQYVVFNPSRTYLCAKTKIRKNNDTWNLIDIWIEDQSNPETKQIPLPMTGFVEINGTDDLWGDDGPWQPVSVVGDNSIQMYPIPTLDMSLTFAQVTAQNYYELRMIENTHMGRITSLVTSEDVHTTTLTKYGETQLYRIGASYTDAIYFKITYDDGTEEDFQINNSAAVYIAYEPIDIGDGVTKFDLNEVMPNGIILYADMKASPSEAAIDYYRMPLSAIEKNQPIMYLISNQLPTNQNGMRVVMEARLNGVVTGRIEMQPVQIESDGSIRFDTIMYPLNKLVDVDNRIQIASLDYGGGTWIPSTKHGMVSIDATTPELTMYIMFKSTDTTLVSPIDDDPEYIGYRLQDKWNVDAISFVQELKEMRSVVNFGEYLEPSETQSNAYESFMKLGRYDMYEQNLYTIREYAYHINTDTEDDSGLTFSDIRNIAAKMDSAITGYIELYTGTDVPDLQTEYMTNLQSTLKAITEAESSNNVDWETTYTYCADYVTQIDDIFSTTSVNSGIEIQLVPYVQSSLMTSELFADFVHAFTQVHKAIEPVIFKRLEGNNYLDCKLIATYGLPHSYVADLDKNLEPPVFWPDLNIQIEFDVKLYNPALSTNTLNELRSIVKSYFNRITTVHTPLDMISMDNNIYISQLIRLMTDHANVAYLKFKGWYTDQKNISGGNYMNADYQAIVQKWDKLEDMPKKELERYVPEMFVLSDSNIVLNLI